MKNRINIFAWSVYIGCAITFGLMNLTFIDPSTGYTSYEYRADVVKSKQVKVDALRADILKGGININAAHSENWAYDRLALLPDGKDFDGNLISRNGIDNFSIDAPLARDSVSSSDDDWAFSHLNPLRVPNPVVIFIIAGQSNASGTATGFPQRAALMDPQGIIYNSSSPHATIFVPPSSGLNRLCALSNTEGALNNRAHGIELNLAYQYQQYFGKPCIILKETAGATSINVEWISGGTLRNRLISRANTLTTLLTSRGISWSYGGVYWNQWEGDVNNASYKTHLEALAAELRSSITGNSTSVPFVACRPSVKVTFGGDITAIRAAISTASITNYAVLNQDDLFYQEPDASLVHANSYSQNLLAERFLTAVYPGITFAHDDQAIMYINREKENSIPWQDVAQVAALISVGYYLSKNKIKLIGKVAA